MFTIMYRPIQVYLSQVHQYLSWPTIGCRTDDGIVRFDLKARSCPPGVSGACRGCSPDRGRHDGDGGGVTAGLVVVEVVVRLSSSCSGSGEASGGEATRVA